MKPSRDSKYTKEIMSVIENLGHATNSQILSKLRSNFPKVSATTIHRATSRLLERGMISEAPTDARGSMRYDSTISPHDHFICSLCDGMRDIDIAEEFIPKIRSALGGCRVTGRLIIHGSCEKCLIKENS